MTAGRWSDAAEVTAERCHRAHAAAIAAFARRAGLASLSMIERVSRVWVLAAAAGVTLLAGFVWWRANALRDDAVHTGEIELSARADAAKLIVSEWLLDRRRGAIISADYAATMAGGGPLAGAARQVQSYFRLRQQLRSYTGAWLLDAAGTPVVRSPGALEVPDSDLRRFARAAAGGPEATPVPWIINDSTLILMFGAPVTREPGGRPIGTVLLAVNPRLPLFPLLYSERTPLHSGAANLVAHIGDEYVVLTAPHLTREGPGAARVPWSRAPYQGQLAIRGAETFGRFTDYRGVPVFSALRHLPGVEWGLIRQVDEGELLAGYQRRLAVEVALAFAAIAVLAAGFFAYTREQRATRLQILAQSADDLRASAGQLRELARRVETVREDEQIRIAREIHDQMGQELSAMRLALTWLVGGLPPDAGPARETALGLIAQVERTIDVGRRISAELRPPMLEDLGLGAALEWYLERFVRQYRIDFDLDVGDGGLPPAIARALYRIAQEALTNVARHSGASRVSVSLTHPGDAVELVIQDNGTGIPPDRVRARNTLGLLGMRERALAVSGEVTIGPGPSGGTVVRVRVPLAEAPVPAS